VTPSDRTLARTLRRGCYRVRAVSEAPGEPIEPTTGCPRLAKADRMVEAVEDG